MKKNIAIVGSTGSIGKTLLSLVNNKNYKIVFLAANRNYRNLLSQAVKYRVKNLIIIDPVSYSKALKFKKNKTIKIYNSFEYLNKIIKKKLDYVMSSFSGINGLEPTYKLIKYTKTIAIANKESIICAWPLLKKELNKYKTNFIPVDSEHFSIWSDIKYSEIKNIKKIFLTASGGPLLKLNSNKLKKINRSLVLNHPKWKMGEKISVDSATLMNKCFEVMEAKSIFEIDYKKIKILIHPDSYVHAIVQYNNGITKLIVHDTTMKIPIFNTINSGNELYKDIKILNLKRLNNLDFQPTDTSKFPILNLLKLLPNKHSMFETVIVSINDIIVKRYLDGKIQFNDITRLILKFIKNKEYQRFKHVYPKNINQIKILNKKINDRISNIIR
jgi:1-deoxy-D-xylulose-5-phosphate reductoisomerase